MSVTNIASGYGLNFWQAQQSGADGSGSSTLAGSSSYQGAFATQAYAGAGDIVNTLATAVARAMKTLGLGENDRVTFATINEARAKMESNFTAKVKEDLKELGVDETIEFRLVTNSNGGVHVISDHPDKKKIEKYLQDNPDMVAQFQDIQAMSNIEEARKTSGYDVRAMRNRIQVASMVDWFAQSGQGVQQFMQYSDVESVFSAAGINKIA